MNIEFLKNEIKFTKKPNFPYLHLFELYRSTLDFKAPIILELGVDKGNSTKIFIDSIKNKENSKLISVDIKDCSNVLQSNKWMFIKENSANISSVINQAPLIKEREIDILFIDSLHHVDHIKKELYGYFQYLNPGAYIFFDDVDSGPYMKKQRKDSINTEIENRKIFDLLEAIFRANYSSIDFSVNYGSTGLAKFVKHSNLGDKLNFPLFISKRRFRIFWRILEFMSIKKSYKHNYSSNDSFLISPK